MMIQKLLEIEILSLMFLGELVLLTSEQSPWVVWPAYWHSAAAWPARSIIYLFTWPVSEATVSVKFPSAPSLSSSGPLSLYPATPVTSLAPSLAPDNHHRHQNLHNQNHPSC